MKWPPPPYASTISQDELETIPVDERLRESGFTPLPGDEPEPYGWALLLGPAVALVGVIALAAMLSPHVARVMGW